MSKNTAKSVVSVPSASTATVVIDATPETIEMRVNRAFEYFMAEATEKSVVSEIIDMYGKADKSDKAAMRTMVENIRDARLEELDMVGAVSAKMTRDAMVSTPTSKKSEIDYNVVVAHRIVALRHAAHAILSGITLPEGIEKDMIDIDTISDLVVNFGESDITDEIVKAAHSLATAKITRSGARRSIQDVIDAAFEDAESGHFMTVADIRRKGATPDYTPSDGAIAARLFPKSGKCTLSGIEAVEATATDPRGARKI